MADDVFADGEPLSTSYLNDMYTRLIRLETTEAGRNATVENATGTVTFETRMYAVKRKNWKPVKEPKNATISFENAKFPINATVIYSVTPEWADETPLTHVYWKIEESDYKSVRLTYWAAKDGLTVDWNVIAVALVPKTL
jgi:hypothetical protein